MANNEIKVTFETITPLYTGDAWQEFKEIRLSSLIGSLRFWFEIICYFGGICSEKDFDKEKGRFEKEISQEEFKKRLLKYGTDFEGQIEALKELEIPLPAIIFGTTGWKSLIEIKSIRYLDDYCFGNKLNLPTKFCISKNENKEVKENNECPKRSNNDWSVFYFKIPYFWGKFEVVFRVHKDIKESIFSPLLNFMDKYGYWGGGWNIGYGRLKVLSVNSSENGWRKDEFDFPKFKSSKENLEGNWNGNFNSLISTVNYNGLINKDIKDIDENIDKITKTLSTKRVKKIQIEDCNLDIKEAIKDLVEKKAKLRLNMQNKEERHKIFGSIESPPKKEFLPQGSKILPYINRLDNNFYECGFLSIAGILRLYIRREGK